MNATFGLLLRQEIVKYMETTPNRNRAHSSGSQRLSIDSSDGHTFHLTPNFKHYSNIGGRALKALHSVTRSGQA